MNKYHGKIGVLFSLVLAIAAARAADKPSVQARIDMEARNAGTYSATMTANEAASHYAHERVAEGKKDYAKVAQTCADCADMAGLAAKLSARNSPMAGMVSEMMAKCCDTTVIEAEKLNDPALTACIEHCKKAALAARETEKAQ